MKCLSNIDIYGTRVDFTLFDDTKYKTSCGGFITILTGILFLICFYYFGKDFYNRTNPHFLRQMITVMDYPIYTLNRNDLFLAVRLEDNNGNYFNNSGYVEIQYSIKNYMTDSSGNFQSTSNPLEFTNCTMLNLTKMRLETNKNLSEMSCIKFDNTQLGGFWDAPILNFIQIIYSPCINTTINGNSCLDPYLAAETLNSQLISFNIYSMVYFTDLNDYDNPLKSKLYNYYTYVNTQASKNMRLFYRQANISNDLNYIIQAPEKYSLFGIDNFLIDNLKVNPSFENAKNDTNIALIEIYFSNNIETFDVAYLKLQEILATLGGILTFVTVVLKILARFFNIHYRNLEIFNELFDFNDFKNEEKLNSLIKSKLNFKKHKNMNKFNKNNTNNAQIILDNKISSSPEIIENCNPPNYNDKARLEISNISIENSKNQLFNNDVNKQGKFIYNSRKF